MFLIFTHFLKKTFQLSVVYKNSFSTVGAFLYKNSFIVVGIFHYKYKNVSWSFGHNKNWNTFDSLQGKYQQKIESRSFTVNYLFQRAKNIFRAFFISLSIRFKLLNVVILKHFWQKGFQKSLLQTKCFKLISILTFSCLLIVTSR